MFAAFAFTFVLSLALSLGRLWMCILALTGLLLGTYALVTPGEAHLNFSVFIFALAFPFIWMLEYSWQVVLQRLSSVLGVLLASDPVMHQFSQTFVRAEHVLRGPVVPK